MNIDLHLGVWYTGMFCISGLGVEDQPNGQRQVPLLMISFCSFYYFNPPPQKKMNMTFHTTIVCNY